jgi:hypothetical protein
VGDTVDCYLAFLHCFQQSRLCLCWSAIDFIRQEEVGEYRAWSKLKCTGRFLIDTDTSDVGWHEIRGELHAPEANVESTGEDPYEQCLRSSGYALEEHMTASNEGGEYLIDHFFLAQDSCGDGFANALKRG